MMQLDNISQDYIAGVLNDPMASSQDALAALRASQRQQIDGVDDMQGIFMRFRSMSDQSGLSETDVLLLEELFSKIPVTYTSETIRSALEEGAPKSLFRLYEIINEGLRNGEIDKGRGVSLLNDIVRVVQDLAVFKDKATQTRPGQEACAPIWVPHLVKAAQAVEHPTHVRESTRALIDLISKGKQSRGMLMLTGMERDMRTLIEVTMPSMGDFTAQENVMEIVLLMCRKKLLNPAKDPLLSSFPSKVIDLLVTSAAKKSSDLDMDEVVRAATMAYNESLGKDRTVFSLPVRKIQVGDHVSDLDQPFVDFGRTSVTFHGTGGADEDAPEMQELAYEHIKEIRCRDEECALVAVDRDMQTLTFFIEDKSYDKATAMLSKVQALKALSGGRTGKGAKMSVGMMPTPYGHIPLAKSVPGSEQENGRVPDTEPGRRETKREPVANGPTKGVRTREHATAEPPASRAETGKGQAGRQPKKGAGSKGAGKGGVRKSASGKRGQRDKGEQRAREEADEDEEEMHENLQPRQQRPQRSAARQAKERIKAVSSPASARGTASPRSPSSPASPRPLAHAARERQEARDRREERPREEESPPAPPAWITPGRGRGGRDDRERREAGDAQRRVLKGRNMAGVRGVPEEEEMERERERGGERVAVYHRTPKKNRVRVPDSDDDRIEEKEHTPVREAREELARDDREDVEVEAVKKSRIARRLSMQQQQQKTPTATPTVTPPGRETGKKKRATPATEIISDNRPKKRAAAARPAKDAKAPATPHEWAAPSPVSGQDLGVPDMLPSFDDDLPSLAEELAPAPKRQPRVAAGRDALPERGITRPRNPRGSLGRGGDTLPRDRGWGGALDGDRLPSPGDAFPGDLVISPGSADLPETPAFSPEEPDLGLDLTLAFAKASMDEPVRKAAPAKKPTAAAKKRGGRKQPRQEDEGAGFMEIMEAMGGEEDDESMAQLQKVMASMLKNREQKANRERERILTEVKAEVEAGRHKLHRAIEDGKRKDGQLVAQKTKALVKSLEARGRAMDEEHARYEAKMQQLWDAFVSEYRSGVPSLKAEIAAIANRRAATDKKAVDAFHREMEERLSSAEASLAAVSKKKTPLKSAMAAFFQMLQS